MDLPNISVVPESTYYIVWTTTSGDIGEPFFWWGYGKVNPGDDLYTRGSQWLNCDYLWYDVSFADFCFKTFGYSIPSVTITVPVDGSSVYGLVSIQGTAVDNDGVVQKVEVKIDDGSWMSATGTTNWNYNWDTTNVVNGYHVIHARSYDGESYSNEVSIGVNVTKTELLIEDVNGAYNSVYADIHNIGDFDANNVNITILIQGGLFNRINVEDSGTTPVIQSDELYTFHTDKNIFGFGLVDIIISAEANNADMVTKELKGLALGSYIFVF
ncbi:MAG: Ig-like domain-containing protein [Candidatus Thermoplasmatota archaeon]|nr:Ig-like domain-containing protein [Candidatus Thermoplasmatota archaeon]